MDVLTPLGYTIAPLLGIYLAFKLGDMFIRETFVYLYEVNTASVMFTIELVVGNNYSIENVFIKKSFGDSVPAVHCVISCNIRSSAEQNK
jgi:hypothetical protein